MSVSPETASRLKYRRILDQLEQEIVRGDYAVGDKLPSEADLIRRFGTSRITVGRAVNELRERGLVERRAGSGTYVRTVSGVHRPAAPAATPVIGTYLLFGLLIPDLGETEIFEPICRGMAEAPQSERFSLLWGGRARGAVLPTEVPVGPVNREERAWNLCQYFIERGVSGVFFAPFEGVQRNAGVNARILAALDAARVPVVLLDRDIHAYPRRTAHDLVGLDNRRAGYLATEHLLAHGRRRIAFAAPADSAATVDERLAGYREALFAAGIAADPDLVRRVIADDPSEARRLAEWLPLSTRPDALVCANDRLAGQLMHGMIAHGCRVPQDMAIVGIDDVRYASLLSVPLTTVHQPCREIGEAAVAAMLERIARPGAAPRDILLEGSLVVRASCGANGEFQSFLPSSTS